MNKSQFLFLIFLVSFQSQLVYGQVKKPELKTLELSKIMEDKDFFKLKNQLMNDQKKVIESIVNEIDPVPPNYIPGSPHSDSKAVETMQASNWVYQCANKEYDYQPFGKNFKELRNDFKIVMGAENWRSSFCPALVIVLDKINYI